MPTKDTPIDLNKEIRPELALFMLACEFRMRLHDQHYGDSWREETRHSVFAGLDRNLYDFKRAVLDQDAREQANESCDVTNWVRFLPFQNPEVVAEFKKMARAVGDKDYVYPEHPAKSQ